MAADDHLGPQFGYHGTASTFRKGQALTGAGADKHGRFESGTPGGTVYYTDDISNAKRYAERAARKTESPSANVYKVERIGSYSARDTHDAAGFHTDRLRVVGRLDTRPGYPPRLL